VKIILGSDPKAERELLEPRRGTALLEDPSAPALSAAPPGELLDEGTKSRRLMELETLLRQLVKSVIQEILSETGQGSAPQLYDIAQAAALSACPSAGFTSEAHPARFHSGRSGST
jgi:hypothetical protein